MGNHGKRQGPRHICILRPGIWADAAFQDLSCRAKLLWLGLAGFLDCEGRALYDPERLAAEIFPGQVVAMDDLFEELQIMEMVALYDVDGITHVQMLDFARHQRRDRRRISRLPDRTGRLAAKPENTVPVKPVTHAVAAAGGGSAPVLPDRGRSPVAQAPPPAVSTHPRRARRVHCL